MVAMVGADSSRCHHCLCCAVLGGTAGMSLFDDEEQDLTQLDDSSSSEEPVPEREPAPEPEPEPEQLAAGICQHKARESVAPNEVVHWNVYPMAAAAAAAAVAAALRQRWRRRRA